MGNTRRWPPGLTLMALAWVTVACGQKGPPLAPLHLVPAGVSEATVRRVGDRALLRFVLPTRNENGPGRLELDRVEIYAMTVGPDGEPSAEEVMSAAHLAGQIAVRPVLEEGQQHPPDEKRPEPGTPVTFDEELTAQKLQPEPVKTPAKPAPSAAGAATSVPAAGAPGATVPPAAGTAPAGAPPPVTPTTVGGAPATATGAPAATTLPAAGAAQIPAGAAQPPGGPPAAAAGPPVPRRTYARRIYITRGVTSGGRRGTPSTPVAIPLVDLPAAPADIKPRVTQAAVILEWTAAGASTAYNVYRGDDLLQPLNSAPLTSPAYESSNPAFGQEQCFRVRGVTTVDAVNLEGEPSAPQCVTPLDRFPPAPPEGLAGVPTPGQISLIWNANAEKDLAGYLILRGDAPDGELKAITPAPIKETSYRDATVTPGTRYIYAIVAVDTATPPNVSPQSARVEETAR